jgi:hypothetical protein
MFSFASTAAAGKPTEPERKSPLRGAPSSVVKTLVGVPRVGAVRRVRAKAKRGAAINEPPLLQTSVKNRHTYRFLTSATVDQNFTAGNVAAALGAVVTVNATTKICISSSFRVRKIRIWAPAAAAAENACQVTWYTVEEHAEDAYSANNTVGTAGASYFETSPPKGTFADMWSNTSSAATVLFGMNLATNAIVDIDIESTLINNLTPLSVSSTGALGAFGFDNLDGATGHVQPVGLPLLR